MCLGIPGKVVDTYRENDVLMGKVDFGGVSKRVCLEHVPHAKASDYVLVHVGFALSLIDALHLNSVTHSRCFLILRWAGMAPQDLRRRSTVRRRRK